MKIFDCHCHFVTLKDFELYKKTSLASHFLNIRAINHSSLIPSYDFKTFENIDNMFLTESVDLDDLDKELVRIKNNIQNQNNIVGIKIFLGYQSYYANDEKIREVTKIANKYGLSMIFHCGETYSTDGSINKDNYADAVHLEELVIDFPNVNFIASHMNWPNFDNVFSLCEKYSNVFTCISGALDEEDKKERSEQVNKTINIINKYLIKFPNLKNKLMYGTDFFSTSQAFIDVSDYLKIIEALNLSKEEKENVLYNNIFNAYRKLK